MKNNKPNPFGPRRADYFEINAANSASDENEIKIFDTFDTIYRAVCSMMYNFSPLTGHPGGSISSGRIVASLLYKNAFYDISNPNRADADLISYSAGHKSLGLYAQWALRNEMIRIVYPELLPKNINHPMLLHETL